MPSHLQDVIHAVAFHAFTARQWLLMDSNAKRKEKLKKAPATT
jgi:hypothetical protein